jgi:hypothetical protein
VSPNRLPSRHPACIVIDADWRNRVEWWTDPRLAYAAGLADGYAAGRAEQDAIDDQVHRQSVRTAIRIIETTDARRAADRGERQQAA